MKSILRKLKQSQIEIEFELPAEDFDKYFAKALTKIKLNTKIDGFRPGQAPDSLIEEIKAKEILLEAAQQAVTETYTNYLLTNAIEPLGQPEVQILKMAKGNPFIFTVKVYILPQIDLPDYREISRQVPQVQVEVTDQEVRDSLLYLQQSRAKFIPKNEPAQKEDFVDVIYQSSLLFENKEFEDKFILGKGKFIEGFEDNIVGMKPGEKKEFKITIKKDSPFFAKIQGNIDGQEQEMDFKVELKGVFKVEIPQLDDDFAKKLGRFGSLKDLEESIREGIKMEKEEEERQRRRIEILDRILQHILLEVPEPLLMRETQRLLQEFKKEIKEKFNLEFSEYLATIKQTEQDLQTAYRQEAERRLKRLLIIKQIGKREKIEVTEEEIEKEINQFIKNFTLEEAKKIDIQRLKEYTKDVIYNEKVLQLLESF